MTTLALILAGGKGNRFWPKSSPNLPKQFLQICGTDTLLQATVKRVERLVKPEHIFIITGVRYVSLVKEQVPDIPEENILVEPMGKDTAPAVVYSAFWLEKRYGDDAVLITLPADHFIADEEAWLKAIQTAVQGAVQRECPILIGTTPKRLETCFGYIIPGERIDGISDSIHGVEQFVEKPDVLLAQNLMNEKNAVWNSGIFVWRIAIILKLARQHQPELAKQIKEVIQEMTRVGLKPNQENIPSRVVELFQGINPISIDYGLLEHCRDLAVVAASFNWDDLGGWQALERLHPVDLNGNVQIGNVSLTATEHCIIHWKDGPAIIAGLKDTVVVGHEGKLLVCKKEYLSQLKGLLGEYAEVDNVNDPSPTLKTVPKPWGKEIWWAVTAKYAAKILEIMAGHGTSLHLHQKKLETFYIEKGRGKMLMADRVEELYPGQVLTVRPGVAHRIMAITDLRLFEVSTIELDDVIRLEDHYGRADCENRGF